MVPTPRTPTLPAPTLAPTLAPTRRAVLRAGGAVAVATAATGCDLLSTDPSSGAGTGAGTGGGGAGGSQNADTPRESPALTKQVHAGKLPPLKDRLPDEPLELQPVKEPGRYGGTWHNALLGTAEAAYIYCLTGYEQLVNWTSHWTGAAGTKEIKPNVARRFEMSEDGTTYTFWLRTGMRWSDGKPLTVDDVLFAFNDVYMNTDLNPVTPSVLSTPSGKAAQIEKVDDSSFRIIFPEPAGLFLQHICGPTGYCGYGLVGHPQHHLKQFHKKYNPDVDKLVDESGQRDWITLFQAKSDPWGQNPDLPSLTPWSLKTPFGQGTRVVLDRNPYYWKVDPNGSQLPYLDEVVFEIVQNDQVMVLKATHGDINLEVGPDLRFTTPANKPVLAKGRKKGGYGFVEGKETRMNIMAVFLNLAHKDPVKKEIFDNRDFRIGLSYAINRRELINAALQRQGEPYQVAPLPESPFYDKTYATQYLEHDVAKANEHLDKTGWTDRDSEGIRLGPDGKPIAFTVEFAAKFRPEWPDMLELVRRYWRKVGVKIQVKPEDRSLWEERQTANELDATVFEGGGGVEVLVEPKYYFPTRPDSSYAVPWGEWYSSQGKSGQKPPAKPRHQMALYDKLRATVEPEEQTRLMKEALKISQEQFYSIGTVRSVTSYFVKNDRFRNIPDPMIRCWVYPTPGPTEPSQYFLAES